jgi:hypothetical protein
MARQQVRVLRELILVFAVQDQPGLVEELEEWGGESQSKMCL